MVKKFEKVPSSTGVMEFFARSKNINLKDFILNFANLQEIKDNVNFEKKEIEQRKLHSLNTQFPFKHEQFYLNLTTPYTLKSGKTIMRFVAYVDDFEFNTFYTTNTKGNINLVNNDLTKDWRKMLFEFDKAYMFSEFSELMEYQKQKALEKFNATYTELKTKHNERIL